MKLRALVVEDDTDQLEGLALAFRSISEAERQRYGIDDLSVEKADCAQIEREILEEASRSEQPFDILLQDLNLPAHPGGKEEGVWVGLDLLEFAHNKKAAKEIGVVSAFTDFESVSTAFLRGAVDFIPKPYDPEYLQGRILQLWERRLMKESARVLEDRFKILTAESDLIYRVNYLSNFVLTIHDEVERVERILSERFGLDAKDNFDDPLLRHLTVMEQTVKEAREELKAPTRFIRHMFEREELSAQNDVARVEAQEVNLEEALNEVMNVTSACLVTNGVTIKIPATQKTQVISFGKDVWTVIGEIILGGISELPNQNDLSKDTFISVDRIEKTEKAEIRFIDNLTPITNEKARAINRGEVLPHDGGFGRAWGLSVVHHVALRGGGHLNVEPYEQGNVITYFIPLAQNA
jgi:CheY-like chemotaxis protein